MGEYSQKWYHFQFFNGFILPIFIKSRAMIKRFLRSKDTDAYLEIRSVRRFWNFMFNDTTIISGINVSSTTCGVKSVNSIMEGLEFEVPIYIFTPENFDDKKPTMFYYHGGGWSNCSVQTHFKMCQSIAKILNIRVISPNYRLAPEHAYPTPLNDCFFSTIKLIEKLKITDFILSGDSAGGNLAVAVGIKMSQSNNFKPLLIAPVYGSFNMFNFSTSSFKNENFPTLKRSRVIAAMQMYGCGKIDAHVTELIKKDKFHNLFETEVGRLLIKNSCLKEKYHEVQNREFSSSGYQNAVTSKLVKNILDPCFHILGAEDKLLRELLDNTKVGIIVQYCEHDVIRDDSLILLERLRSLKSDKLVEEVRAVGGVHAMFQICTYGLSKKAPLSRYFGGKMLKRADFAFEDWTKAVQKAINS